MGTAGIEITHARHPEFIRGPGNSESPSEKGEYKRFASHGQEKETCVRRCPVLCSQHRLACSESAG